MLESNHSRQFQTNRCRAALTPDYTPSPAKWLWLEENHDRFGGARFSGSLGANAALPDASPPPELWVASSPPKLPNPL